MRKKKTSNVWDEREDSSEKFDAAKNMRTDI